MEVTVFILRLALDKHPDVGGRVGGAAVEWTAQRGDPSRFPFPHIMSMRCVVCEVGLNFRRIFFLQKML